MLARTKRYKKHDPLKRKAQRKLLGANVSNWTNERLESVLNHPLNMGVDGKDYGPIAHLLRDEYHRRFNTRYEKQLKQDEKDWQDFEAYASHRKQKLKVIIQDLKLHGGLTYPLALDLKRELEFLTENEVCPFTWAVFENNYKPEKEV